MMWLNVYLALKQGVPKGFRSYRSVRFPSPTPIDALVDNYAVRFLSNIILCYMIHKYHDLD